MVVNGSQSSWLLVNSEVSQGTVLGPLLFLLYIKDITANIKSDIRLSADDCMYDTISSPHDGTIPQEDINTLHSWTKRRQMQFNSKKCYIMSTTRQRSKPDNSYHLGADMLARVDSYPYLGVIISSDLKWHNHISHITAKASRTLSFVRRNVYNCPPEAKSLAHTSLIRPQLEYMSATIPGWRHTTIGKSSA